MVTLERRAYGLLLSGAESRRKESEVLRVTESCQIDSLQDILTCGEHSIQRDREKGAGRISGRLLLYFL